MLAPPGAPLPPLLVCFGVLLLLLTEPASIPAAPVTPRGFPALPVVEVAGGQPKEEVRRARFPGAGRAGRGCGREVRVGGKVRRALCAQRSCPDCSGLCPGREDCKLRHPRMHRGGEWAHRAALRTRRALEGWMRREWYAWLLHAVVSVDPVRFGSDADHGEVIAEVRRLALEEARMSAWEAHGGVAVVHLWRDCYGGVIGRWGPHVHLVCEGIEVGTETAKAGGLVVTIAGSRGAGGPFTLYRGERLLRLLVYLLDHSCAVPGSPSIVRYGGARARGRRGSARGPARGLRAARGRGSELTAVPREGG